MTTAAIEKKTGVSRSTIYFYIRQGLLPEPQKTAGGRALYSEEHVELLRSIGELKRDGLPLAKIKEVLKERVVRAHDHGVDLAVREYERVHSSIIHTAIEEFMAKGYKQTHVSTIIQKLGINPQLFYSHFPGKLQLLAECFRFFIDVKSVEIESEMQTYDDPVEKAVRRLARDRRGDELGSMLAAAIRSEGRLDPVEHASIQDALDNITARFGAEIGAARASDGPACLVSNELLAYGLLGALSFQSMRVSWRRGLDNTDLLRAHLFIHLAILAAVKGEVDIDGRLAEYEDLIREVGADMPDGPPTFAD